jgi:RimJ/RimL family protein N-acetyltransferase
MNDLASNLPRPRPSRVTLSGQYGALVPLDTLTHGEALFAASMAPGAEQRFRYLFEAPSPRVEFQAWLENAARSTDPLYFAVVDVRTGRCEGRQALMRIVPEHGVIEIGSILWGPAIAGTRLATESLFLTAQYAFDQLKYRRFEWKCDSANEPSRRAALRFGFAFEGVFRQHMVVKGRSRDTAWYSMTDDEWSQLRPGYRAWLAPENFGPDGVQRSRLSEHLPRPARLDRD